MATLDIDGTIGDIASNDIIDSRDMEALITELEDIEEAAKDEDTPGEPLTEDQAEMLEALREVREACGREWVHGVTYIRDSYWTDYAQELAEDIGAIPKALAWPACHIDWEAAADALRQDYSTTEIGGVDFHYRA